MIGGCKGNNEVLFRHTTIQPDQAVFKNTISSSYAENPRANAKWLDGGDGLFFGCYQGDHERYEYSFHIAIYLFHCPTHLARPYACGIRG